MIALCPGASAGVQRHLKQRATGPYRLHSVRPRLARVALAKKLGRLFSCPCHRLMCSSSGSSTTFTDRAKSSATPRVMSAMEN